jgi:hypothetical protein
VPALVQQALTAVFPVRAGRGALLAPLIEARAAELRAKLSGVASLHFARLVLLGAGPESNGEHPEGDPGELVFATTFDGAAEAHLDELWQHAGTELDPVFAEIDGWVAPGTRASFGRFVARYAQTAAALLSAHEGLSVSRIRADGELRSGLSRWLSERDHELRALSALEIVERARGQLAPSVVDGARADEAVVVAPPVGARLPLGDALALAVTCVRSFAADCFALVAALWHDTLPSSAPGAPTNEAGVARCFSHVAAVKPGRFRRGAVRLALRALGNFAQRATRSGKLLHAEAVHSARFMLLEDGRLLFFADFDASLEAVLSRAAERASSVLGMIWSHTRGFPPGLGFCLGGARDVARFREWAHGGALVTPLSYGAYPELGAREVRENAEIRGLFTAALDETRAERLLSLVRD